MTTLNRIPLATDRRKSSRSEDGARSIHILVADDDAFTRKMNELTLSRRDQSVDSAQDGREAWRMLQNKTYDLVVTDNQMPGLFGLDLLKKLRANGRVMPVVLASASLGSEEVRDADWLEPFVILPKPFTQRQLLDVVESVLLTGRLIEAEMGPGDYHAPLTRVTPIHSYGAASTNRQERNTRGQIDPPVQQIQRGGNPPPCATPL